MITTHISKQRNFDDVNKQAVIYYYMDPKVN